MDVCLHPAVSDFRLRSEWKVSWKEILDVPSLWSELLLRIDSMLVTGAVRVEQVSALRGLALARDAQAAKVFTKLLEKDDRELASGLLPLLDPKRKPGLHVVHICTEMAPLAGSGSLAIYITNLCQALFRRGHLVEVILPK
jgi:starch synthase